MTKKRPPRTTPDAGSHPPVGGQIVLYQTEDGRQRIEVRLEGETVWLTQAGMAELYQTTPQNITLHIKAIYEEGELEEPATCKDYLQVRSEGTRQVQRALKHYNLEVIYALSADYDADHPMAQEFFATVQNKMLYAASGKTAAELIRSRADAALPNMGLTTWKGAGRGRALTKADTTIAKNYLNRQEMETLELLVGQYLDFAELQARQRNIMYMADWKAKLDDFLRLNNQEILTHAGRISKELAEETAHTQYEEFARNRRRIEADQADEELRRQVRRLTEGPKEDDDA
ncbi:MAG: virulence RhuM family protein [Planctomycetes bacterium]|jgi:hypothetical protein|nr:virulence RhuM family protein [Planctomycetota bacterium]